MRKEFMLLFSLFLVVGIDCSQIQLRSGVVTNLIAYGVDRNLSPLQDIVRNGDIIAMRTSKISDNVIISNIISSKCDFDLTVQGILNLKNAKISDKVIKIMFTASPPIEIIHNEDIIRLSSAKISKDIISQIIISTPHDFDVSPDGLIKLKTSKVNAAIIQTMMVNPKQERRK